MPVLHICDDKTRLCVLDEHFQSGHRVDRIERDYDRTRLQYPQHGGYQWRIMRHQDRDAIAGGRSAADESMRQPVCRFVQFPIGRLPPVRTDSDARWNRRCHPLKRHD